MENLGGAGGVPVRRVAKTAPAKINLWLEVIRKREDGYHDLSSLMLPVRIHDDVDVEVGEGAEIHLECEPDDLPCDGSNLAYRAAERFLAASSQSADIRIRLRKRIPVGAGMGGGSSDAAAVLLALNELLPGKLSERELEAVALGLGADVPFFLEGRPALATGVGEHLEPVSGVPAYPLVFIKPGVEVSTALVYRNLRLTRGESRIKLRAFMDRPWDLKRVLENDLEAVTIGFHPEVGEIKQWLLDHGALGALMSGSGPTVFGVFDDAGTARAVVEAAEQVWPGCWVAASGAQTEPDHG